MRYASWLSLFIVISPCFAADFDCAKLLGRVTQPTAWEYRMDLLKELRTADIPAAVRVHPDGTMIPIILLSKQSAEHPLVQNLLKNTMGMGIDISQGRKDGNNVDHGLARVGNTLVDIIYQGAGMERDQSGNVKYGSNEINHTALRFRDIGAYMGQRHPGSRVQIELAYVASHEDLAKAMTYHNMRRAGLLNIVIETIIRWEKNWNADWLPDYLKNQPRTFADGCTTVNCFTNYMGTRIPAHIDAMKWHIGQMHLNADELLANPAVNHFIGEAMETIRTADWRDPKALHPHMLDVPKYHQMMAGVPGFSSLTPTQKNDLMSYLVAIRASQQYFEVTHAQGADVFAGRDADAWDHWPRNFAGKHLEMDSKNPRAVAVLVYSDWPDAPQLIREGRFQYEGAIWGIWRSENSPDRNRQVPLGTAPIH